MFESRPLAAATFFLNLAVSRIIGATRRLEKSSASASRGKTNIIGPGSMSIAYAIMLSSHSVFPTCDDATITSLWILGSVNASMISFRYGVLAVLHRPGSALLSVDRRRNRSAQSATPICKGGLKYDTQFATLILSFASLASLSLSLIFDSASLISSLSLLLFVVLFVLGLGTASFLDAFFVFLLVISIIA